MSLDRLRQNKKARLQVLVESHQQHQWCWQETVSLEVLKWALGFGTISSDNVGWSCSKRGQGKHGNFIGGQRGWRCRQKSDLAVEGNGSIRAIVDKAHRG